ncbi:hypothetical protein PoB_003128500 [Plakobranchus ocellatus]|uniref:Uncharacterized protein n=1 Tax=Plakobranchus ocellatus TaxID=259542 RepID=A0AAV4A9D4_9GAST|nr:hypothetical protein PoB_003128500 [Plakobranchus ocellatus]
MSEEQHRSKANRKNSRMADTQKYHSNSSTGLGARKSGRRSSWGAEVQVLEPTKLDQDCVPVISGRDEQEDKKTGRVLHCSRSLPDLAGFCGSALTPVLTHLESDMYTSVSQTPGIAVHLIQSAITAIVWSWHSRAHAYTHEFSSRNLARSTHAL